VSALKQPAVLTDPEHWDRYWEATTLPTEIKPGSASGTSAILDVFDRFLPAESPLSVLDIGGAPGGYSVHLWRKFGHHIAVLDNSPVGLELTTRNFEMLGVPGEVLHRDLFSTEPPVPQFDVVYSLGLIEHFVDVPAVVAAHLSYLKPGGTLILGCPNLLGLNGFIMRRLAPSVFDWHNLDVMDLRRWPDFERRLGLVVHFRRYIAGFQPGWFWRCERTSIVYRAMARGFSSSVFRRWNGPVARRLTKLNSRHWSCYAMGVYTSAAHPGGLDPA
jgi:SAM-dependent methyltransferase